MAARHKTTKFARVRVLVAFNNMRAGDEAETVVDEQVQAWINAGLVEVVDSGEDPAGPSAAEPDSEGGEPTEG